MKTRTRKRVLKMLTALAVVTWIIAACCLDSDTPAPLIVCGIDTAWLALMCAANAR